MNKRKTVMDFVLGMDCETTGINFDSYQPSKGHQAISWGFLVIDARTLKVIEELYLEIKWNKEMKAKRKADPNFGKKAESVHGLTYDYLEENGITEKEAATQIANLIYNYWGPNNTISSLGANTVKFDMDFLMSLLNKYGLDPRIAARHIDSHSIGFATVGSFSTDEFFDTMGLDQRDKHNALEDIKMTLEAIRRVRVIWKSKTGVFIEE
jgi:oligoribonuclease (3'-5' exoribonuclease)